MTEEAEGAVSEAGEAEGVVSARGEAGEAEEDIFLVKTRKKYLEKDS